MNAAWQGISLLLDPYVIMVMIIAGLFGLFMGAIPGLSATMAVALLVPVTFFMEPVPALATIVMATAVAIFAGDIPSALLRIPGTPSSAAYTEDAYKMTQKGEAELALGVSLVASVIGGIFGAIVLAFLAPWLADFALRFSTFEYFWLAALGLTCAAFIGGAQPMRGLVSLLIGLFVATIGIDPVAGYPRFSFGNSELMGGINFIAAMVGMFALAEVLRHVTTMVPIERVKHAPTGSIFKGVGKVLLKYKVGLIRGNILGVIIGILPGAGSDIAAWITYAVAKRFSKHPEKFGTGYVEGLVDSGGANNSALAGAWVPALVFGIPGDSITAIVIGVLYMKGMNPGPTVFLYEPQLVYGVFGSFFLANLLLLPMGWAAIKTSKQILNVPRDVLMPVILLFCVVGTFAMNNTVFGVGVMLVFGLLAWFMEENDIPIAPAILGLVLGGVLESNFMTSMINSNGNLLAFFERPIAGALGVLTLLVWLSPLAMMLYRKRRAQTASG